MKRACVFVDGENFRYSLKQLFPSARYTYRHGDYLPATDWHHFFTSLANQFDCELLRTYWYVIEHIDCRPYKVPTDWLSRERVFARWRREQIEACSGTAARCAVLLQIAQEFEAARSAIEARARGWREMQASIESNNDQLEFRRSGSITYELATKKFGVEKGVDTQLATDMIVLADIYDAAIILSGDADYLPAVAAVKGKGRLVYSVSFLGENGNPLPGGARRLRNAVDSRIDLPFEAVRAAMRIERRTQLPMPAARKELSVVRCAGSPVAGL
jgi:uncharacterized LabA/DUF88 family protein